MDELDLTLTQEGFETLDDERKQLYIKNDEDDSYALKFKIKGVKTEQDVDNVLRAKSHEAKLRKQAEDKLKAANDQLAEIEAAKLAAEHDALLKSNDVKAIEESWQTKHNSAIADRDAKLAAATARLEQLTVGNIAESIANEISVVPKLLIPFIKARLKVTEADNDAGFEVRVVDANGQISAMSVSELSKEFAENPEYAKVIKASSSAKSRSTSTDGEGENDFSSTRTPKKSVIEMTGAELTRYMKRKNKEQ